MTVYLAASAEDDRAAGEWGLPLAHMAYGLGTRRLALQAGQLGVRTQGGLMVLCDASLPDEGDPAELARQVVRECGLRGYRGVMADFERPPSDRATALLRALSSALRNQGLLLIVPEAYAGTKDAAVLVSTAISGGTLAECLSEAVAQYPKICLELRRLRMDFPLPCPTGEGVPLSGEALDALLREGGAMSFYSSDLGCHYFSYRKDEKAHFVLYDTAASLLRKAELASSMGITLGLLLYPEVRELLPELAAHL